MTTCTLCQSRSTPLLSWADYPVFAGCADGPLADDPLFRLRVNHCEYCGHTQQAAPPPTEILYREPRAFGYGPTWQGHYDAFAWFVLRRTSPGERVLEIGGGNGVLLKRTGTTEDVEPNPQYALPGVVTHRVYFHDFAPTRKYDVIYASHLIEHVSDVRGFFEKAASCLAPGGRLFLACPDFAKSLQRTHLNAVTSDHIQYFTPHSLAYAASLAGFVATGFAAYRDHGMYLAFEQAPAAVCTLPTLADIPTDWRFYRKRVEEFAQRVDKLPDETFLYGAHTFTLSLLRYVQAPWRFDTVLDNEPTKHNRRLSGTELTCRPPEHLAGIQSPTVALYAGAYSDEIATRILEINPSTMIVRMP